MVNLTTDIINVHFPVTLYSSAIGIKGEAMCTVCLAEFAE
jgi:hypothetical protein